MTQRMSRKLFTDAEIADCFKLAEGHIGDTAKLLTDLGRGEVSAQLARYWCRNLTYEAPEGKLPGFPKIVIIDIETAPILGHLWSLWQSYTGLEQIEQEWHLMSFAAMVSGQPDTLEYRDQRGLADITKDEHLLQRLWEILDDADVIVAHNGRKFDVKKINARFMMHGMRPPSPYRIVDTLETAKRNFAFTSNKLAWLTDKLTTTKKLDHGKFPGHKLWVECMAGNLEAWQEMEEYNRVDVLSLDELYTKFLAWDEKAPNIGNFVEVEGHCCPRCGGQDLMPQAKPYRTQVGQYELFLCGTCWGWSRGRKLINSLDKRRQLLSGVSHG